jgi:hypothetical protein
MNNDTKEDSILLLFQLSKTSNICVHKESKLTLQILFTKTNHQKRRKKRKDLGNYHEHKA